MGARSGIRSAQVKAVVALLDSTKRPCHHAGWHCHDVDKPGDPRGDGGNFEGPDGGSPTVSLFAKLASC